MASIGILGGTFNPPHIGHLSLACDARAELGLERVLLMPVHAPHKLVAADPGPEHRLAMCVLAAQGLDGVSACGLEIERGGPSYTADTLAEIHASHPDAELTFIVGADTAGTLPSWHDPQGVLRLGRLAVAERAGADRGQVLAALSDLEAAVRAPGGGAGAAKRAAAPSGESNGLTPASAPAVPVRGPYFLAMSPIEVSSSLVRRRVAEGAPVEDLVGRAVAAYIAEHNLYEDDEESVG